MLLHLQLQVTSCGVTKPDRNLHYHCEKKAKQAVYQAKFEEDMTRYSQTGFLDVPLNRPSDVSLESIDLDADDQNLESFLKEDCPGLSPLPRDDVPLTRDLTRDTAPVNINILTPSDKDMESVYTTPDMTLDNIKNSTKEN